MAATRPRSASGVNRMADTKENLHLQSVMRKNVSDRFNSFAPNAGRPKPKPKVKKARKK